MALSPLSTAVLAILAVASGQAFDDVWLPPRDADQRRYWLSRADKLSTMATVPEQTGDSTETTWSTRTPMGEAARAPSTTTSSCVCRIAT